MLKEFIENENSEYQKVVGKSKVTPMNLNENLSIDIVEKPTR